MVKEDHIVLVGGGGHCKSLIDVIECGNRYVIAGILDQPTLKNQKVLGYNIIGDDSAAVMLARQFGNFVISVGHTKSNELRVRLFEQIKLAGGSYPVIQSPSSLVSEHSQLGEGSVVMHMALVNAGSAVGRNTIINTGAVIEHDCLIGDHCHISTGAYVNGGCRIGSNVLIGSGAIIIQGILIGPGAIVAAGAVVTKDVAANTMVAGVPALVKKKWG